MDNDMRRAMIRAYEEQLKESRVGLRKAEAAGLKILADLSRKSIAMTQANIDELIKEIKEGK